jgi:hypothetical protein
MSVVDMGEWTSARPRTGIRRRCSGWSLGVLDYSIAPHVNSPKHPESTALGLVAVGDDRAGFAMVGPIQTP